MDAKERFFRGSDEATSFPWPTIMWQRHVIASKVLHWLGHLQPATTFAMGIITGHTITMHVDT